MFDRLRSAFQPIYASGTGIECTKVGVLPDSFVYRDETTLVFDEGTFNREEWECGVREDGLDAWGYRLDLYENMLIRWIYTSSDYETAPWYLSAKKQILWIESPGKSIETMRVLDDHRLEWILRKFVEY